MKYFRYLFALKEILNCKVDLNFPRCQKKFLGVIDTTKIDMSKFKFSSNIYANTRQKTVLCQVGRSGIIPRMVASLHCAKPPKNVYQMPEPLITLASRHAATISLDSSLKRADRNTYKMMTTITLPICNLIHL
jgi:hypothetical protein